MRFPSSDPRSLADFGGLRTGGIGFIIRSCALIERGDQREAVFWMAATYTRCQKVLYHDAGPDEQERHGHGYRAFWADLGIRSFADLQQRSQGVCEMLPPIVRVAEAIMAANPEIAP
mgnify:CR=1 FL=1